jgi:hypothetical protein
MDSLKSDKDWHTDVNMMRVVTMQSMRLPSNSAMAMLRGRLSHSLNEEDEFN